MMNELATFAPSSLVWRAAPCYNGWLFDETPQ